MLDPAKTYVVAIVPQWETLKASPVAAQVPRCTAEAAVIPLLGVPPHKSHRVCDYLDLCYTAVAHIITIAYPLKPP
jgi:hypothetical protein